MAKKQKNVKNLKSIQVNKKTKTIRAKVANPRFAELRILVDAYINLQKSRVHFGNQALMLERDFGKYLKGDIDWIKLQEKKFIEMEKEIQKRMGQIALAHPVGQWLHEVKGIGDTLSGKLLGTIQDIKRFDKPSALRKWFGLALHRRCSVCDKRWFETENLRELWINNTYARLSRIQGKNTGKELKERIKKMTCNCKEPTKPKMVIDKKRMGDVIEYDPRAKVLLYIIADSFIKHSGYYRDLYDQFRAEEDRKNKGLSDGHRYMRARRKMLVIFLEHLYNVWCQCEGIKVRSPYIEQYGGKVHEIINPPNFNIKHLKTQAQKIAEA